MTLRVLEEVPAGKVPEVSLTPGTAVKSCGISFSPRRTAELESQSDSMPVGATAVAERFRYGASPVAGSTTCP